MLSPLNARTARYLSVEEWKQLARLANYKCNGLAELLTCSLRQLQREFRRIFNRAPQEWLDQQRILEAQKLLLRGEPVKFVASELGFKQSSHFSKEFKIRTGVAPSEFVRHSLIIRVCRPEITDVVCGYAD